VIAITFWRVFNSGEGKAASERRLGKMMAEQPKAQGGGANQYGEFGEGYQKTHTATLASQGIDKNLAHRARRLRND
jgi:hypothetical protein